MRSPGSPTRKFVTFRTLLKLSMGVSVGVLPAVVNADTRGPSATLLTLDNNLPGQPLTGALCTAGAKRCFAHVRATPDGHVQTFAAPAAGSYGPPDLQSAYNIPATPVSGTP